MPEGEPRDEQNEDRCGEQACRHLCGQEPVFATIHHTWGPPPHWQRNPGFDTLVQIILEQQVSLHSARAHYLKLREHIVQVRPENLLALSDADFLACQVTRQKRGYLRHLSQSCVHGSLAIDELATLDDGAVVEQLCRVKGIGPWTAYVYLMFALQRADCFPPGDIALIQSMRVLLPELNSAPLPQLYQVAGRWAPHRTTAAFYLWWWYLSSRRRQMPVYDMPPE